tara:strand:+ start:246 stop:1130 length:885 start_codon:yes stop_codon:yes gene_type:complete
MSSEESPQLEKLSFGNQLKEARQRRSFSDIDLAKKTHLGLALIQALEREEASIVQRASYVRGYIRSCAKVLDVDPMPILDAYEQQIGRHVAEKDNFEPLAMRLHSLVKKRKKGQLVAVFTLLALIFSYLYFEPEVQLPTSLSVLESYYPIAEEVLSSAAEVKAEIISEENITNQAPLLLIADEVEPETLLPAITPESSPSAAHNTVSADGLKSTLKLVVRLRCWIEIVDAEGHVLLRDVYEPEQTQRVSGVPPFNVVLGNAAGIDLTMDNQNFDFSRYIRRDRSAHFTIRNPKR